MLPCMNRSPLEIDHVRETEEIASFGGALLLKHLDGRFEIVGGTEEERKRAKEWCSMFLRQDRWKV